ncbi:lasso peptide biosynthesis B2 protein [Sphingomonas sp. KRR8]|uniref:lasso peptide biosynthesis B2 protein n=1 Tax=Sphingomonas sp. KRR8 TaxID=2942996 RepID=UPI0020203E08|nr:lasso peptide biosynthesis B2 protein [Sphingomonas sp. KRR8]URD61589.1 lasso peptide biosynthesis B2 protein [Sphingomonas sp. KRR8]
MPRASPSEYARFLEAVLMLAGASIAIRVLPFRRLIPLMGRGVPPPKPVPADPGLVRVAVKRASARLPWKTVCFQEGLAAHWMMRRRGLDSRLHYGIRPGAARLSAHVWIEVANVIVLGEEEQGLSHQRVAVFPGGQAAVPHER